MIMLSHMQNSVSRPRDEFWVHVNKSGENGCWTWSGSLTPKGYGKFWDGARMVRAHRYAYECLRGAIPAGLQIDHLCRVRNCVNPDHMEPVTVRVNVLRGVSFSAINALRTHCMRGHEFTADNTYWNKGKRECRICRRYAKARARARKRDRLSLAARAAPPDREGK